MLFPAGRHAMMKSGFIRMLEEFILSAVQNEDVSVATLARAWDSFSMLIHAGDGGCKTTEASLMAAQSIAASRR